ncbi:unnamed protein product [Jaminaea pallidilutea]
MLRSAIARSIAAPLTRRATASASSNARCFSSSVLRRSDDHHSAPILQGDGAKPGEVPSNLQQATGLERFEMLGKLEGIDVFDMKPLDASRLGTIKDPIVVDSLAHERVIGCTGYPAGSHDTLWYNLTTHKKHHRCIECGSVYTLNHIKPEHDDGHGHGH